MEKQWQYEDTLRSALTLSPSKMDARLKDLIDFSTQKRFGSRGSQIAQVLITMLLAGIAIAASFR